MKKLKLLKAWTYDGKSYDVGLRLNIEDPLASELIEQGIAEALVETKAKVVEDTETKDAPMTLDEVKGAIDVAIKAATADVKRPTIATVGKDNVLDDPKKGYQNRRSFFEDVIQAARQPERLSDNLKRLSANLIRKQAVMAGKAVGSDEQIGTHDAFGGFLVPVAFTPDVLRIEPEADPMAGRVTGIPMASPEVKQPARVDKNHTTSVSGGLTVARKDQSEPGTTSRMEFEQVVLSAHTLYGFSFATEEVLMDSPQSFAAIIAAGFSDEFTSRIIQERLRGTGVGEFHGINNSPALISVAGRSGQVADTIIFENILDMRSRVWGYNKAIWIANHDCLPTLGEMQKSVGTGGVAIWFPSAQEDVPDLLFGRPLIFSEYTSTVGDAGDIICVNWSQYLEGIYQPMQSAESIHARFINHERAFKFWMRNAGVPWWRSALTPNQSTITLSPYVRLAART